jgi:hypothetical protein
MASEVDQQSKPHSSRFQMVQELGLVLGRDLLDSLQFDDDHAKANKVGLTGLEQEVSLVHQFQFLLGEIGQAPAFELVFEESGSAFPITTGSEFPIGIISAGLIFGRATTKSSRNSFSRVNSDFRPPKAASTF